MKKEYIGVKDLDEAQKKITLRKRNSNTKFLDIEYRSGSWLFAALVTGKGLFTGYREEYYLKWTD